MYRLRKLTGRPLFDGVVAVALGLAVIATSAAKNSVDPFLVYRPRDVAWYALGAFCIVLLMFRRTTPVVVAIVEFIVVTGIWTAGYNAGVLPAVLLVVVYSTVAYAGRREAFVAGGAAVASTAFLYLSDAPLFEGGEVVACIVAYASAMAVGSAYDDSPPAALRVSAPTSPLRRGQATRQSCLCRADEPLTNGLIHSAALSRPLGQKVLARMAR